MRNYVYYVNEEKGVVVAKCPDAIEQFSNRIDDHAFCLFTAWVSKEGYKMDNAVGIARCNLEAGDKFDVVYGKRLASIRLDRKLAAFKCKFYEYAYVWYFKAREEYDRRWHKANHEHDLAMDREYEELIGKERI